MRRVCVRAVCLSCAVGLLLPAVSFADGQLTYDAREVERGLSLDYDGDTVNMTYEDVNPAFGEAFDHAYGYNEFVGTGDYHSMGYVWTTQQSEFIGGTTFSEFHASGSAECDLDVDYSQYSSDGTGESDSWVKIMFDITETQPYSFEAELYEYGGEGATATARLKRTGGDYVFLFDYDYGDPEETGYYAQSGELAPGNYELYLKAAAQGHVSPNGTQELTASFTDVEFIVPEPGTLAMVALAGVAILRRRR